MLIRFTVENYLSFNQRIDFNLLAYADPQHTHHVVTHDGPRSRQLLRTSLIYGANASGKSNLIKAMAFAKNFIVNGIEKHKNIDLKPFKLSENCANKPTRFEFEFYCAGKAYAYGFVLEKHRVVEEWLFDINQAEDISIFERREQLIGFNYKQALFENMAEEEKQRLEFEAKGTRENLLFLTNCQERNIIRFNTIYQWFKETLIVIFPHSKESYLSTYTRLDKNFFERILEFFDFGVQRVHFEPIDLENSRDISETIKAEIRANFPYGRDQSYFISFDKCNYVIQGQQSNLQASQILMVRKNDRGEDIFFELTEESDGTHRLIDLIPTLMTLYQDNTVVVIDELERSLHALLSRKLFDLFLNNPTFKENQSQLIATTHEVTLLDIKQLLRKDEIWFIEKDETQQSMLYSLAGADVDKLNLTNGYLNGRFGAIPFIGDVETLGWKK